MPLPKAGMPFRFSGTLTNPRRLATPPVRVSSHPRRRKNQRAFQLAITACDSARAIPTGNLHGLLRFILHPSARSGFRLAVSTHRELTRHLSLVNHAPELSARAQVSARARLDAQLVKPHLVVLPEVREPLAEVLAHGPLHFDAE
jgi:hypothetical protein